MRKQIPVGRGNSNEKYHSKTRPKQKAKFKASSIADRIELITFRTMEQFDSFKVTHPDLKLI